MQEGIHPESVVEFWLALLAQGTHRLGQIDRHQHRRIPGRHGNELAWIVSSCGKMVVIALS